MAHENEDIPTLVKRANDLFMQRFKYEASVFVCSPGRVNLIGDHVDYNGGYVLPMGIPMATVIVGSLNELSICRIETDAKIQGIDDPKYVEFNIPSKDTAVEPGSPKWANYVKGVVAGFHGPIKTGFDCVIVSSIPVGAGLSSSAAIEVASYTLLEELLSSPSTSLKEKALACQKAEHVFAGCPCGIMDQFVCTFATSGCAYLLNCKTMEGRHIPLDDPSVCILIINSGVKHELSGSEYPLRRAQCEQAAKTLGAAYLCDVSRKALEENKETLDAEVFRRALHVINETEYTLEFVEFLKEKNYVEAGQRMIRSHKSLSDLYNVSCQELDIIVDIASKINGIYGARMTGGGFGGCVVALAETDKALSAMETIRNQCKSQNISPILYICKPCEGTRRLN
ncbi:galactokinase-like [Daphnia pulex]|uniref:galactokinase-like n=1 Tax=Daphnia pulex TaxID=6669 RepID=UPI001EE1276E|nr:galactokinase-like [Daphnia pulex]